MKLKHRTSLVMISILIDQVLSLWLLIIYCHWSTVCQFHWTDALSWESATYYESCSLDCLFCLIAIIWWRLCVCMFSWVQLLLILWSCVARLIDLWLLIDCNYLSLELTWTMRTLQFILMCPIYVYGTTLCTALCHSVCLSVLSLICNWHTKSHREVI